MLLETIVQPTAEVVSLQEAKDHLRLDVSDEDALIRGLIVAAREYCEAALSRTISACTYKLSLESFDHGYSIDRFPYPRHLYRWSLNEGVIRLQKPPVTAVTSIQYLDGNNTTQTLATNTYEVDRDEPGFVHQANGSSWPALGTGHYRVFVTYTAGYTPPTPGLPPSCPAAIRHAIKLLVGHYYENREAVGATSAEMPFTVESLLSTQKWSW